MEVADEGTEKSNGGGVKSQKEVVAQLQDQNLRFDAREVQGTHPVTCYSGINRQPRRSGPSSIPFVIESSSTRPHVPKIFLCMVY